MELIDKSRLIYTTVRPVNEPNKEVPAVLASDIEDLPVICIEKKLKGSKIPLEYNRASRKPYKPGYDLSDEEMLCILHTMKGLSDVETEAIRMACVFIETELEKRDQ